MLNTIFQFDSTHRPVEHPPCSVPIVLMSKLKYEVKGMDCLVVIKTVCQPTDWVISMVTSNQTKCKTLSIH